LSLINRPQIIGRKIVLGTWQS